MAFIVLIHCTKVTFGVHVLVVLDDHLSVVTYTVGISLTY
jgi:hypothetical protein